MDFYILFFCGTCVLTIYLLDYKYGTVTRSDAIQWIKRWWNRTDREK